MKDLRNAKQKELIELLDRYFLSKTRPSLDELIECEDLKSELAELEQENKEQKLINHFFEEDNLLEYWITQIALSGEIGIGLKMTKRLKWIKDQISKI